MLTCLVHRTSMCFVAICASSRDPTGASKWTRLHACILPHLYLAPLNSASPVHLPFAHPLLLPSSSSSLSFRSFLPPPPSPLPLSLPLPPSSPSPSLSLPPPPLPPSSPSSSLSLPLFPSPSLPPFPLCQMKLDLDEGLCRTLMSTPLKKYNVEQVSGRVGAEGGGGGGGLSGFKIL